MVVMVAVLEPGNGSEAEVVLSNGNAVIAPDLASSIDDCNATCT